MFSSGYVVYFGVWEGPAYNSEFESDVCILSHHHSWFHNKKIPMNLVMMVMLFFYSHTTLISTVLSVYTIQQNL